MEPRTVPDRGAPPRAPTARPNPTRLRFALGFGGLAAFSALVSTIVVPPSPAVSTAGIAAAPAGPAALAAAIQQRPVQYVQLVAGQTPPPGATVIDATAPKPITIVTRVPAPAPRTVVVRTTQSGRVIP